MRINNNSTPDYTGYKTLNNNYISGRQINFSANDMSRKVAKEALNNFKKNQNGMTKFFNYINKFEGDVFNILVANFGTAFVCPFVIAYNPISKEDKETRVYSAWREPISAVIATVTQLTLSLNSERYIEKFKYESFNNKPILGEHLDFTAVKDILTNLEPHKKARILNMIYKDFESNTMKQKFIKELKQHKKDFIFSQLGDLENLSTNCQKLANFNPAETRAINKLILRKMGKAEINELITFKAEQVAKKVEEIILKKSPKSIEDIKNLVAKEKGICLKLFNDAIKYDEETKKALIESFTGKSAQDLKQVVKNGIVKVFYTRIENLKQFKNTSSITLALTTVPFVVVLLNWIYPRFMEKFFPQLCKNDQKGSGI